MCTRGVTGHTLFPGNALDYVRRGGLCVSFVVGAGGSRTTNRARCRTRGALPLCYAVCAGPPLVPDLTDRIARYEGEITLLENIVTRIARKRLKYPHVDDGELQVCMGGCPGWSGSRRVPVRVCAVVCLCTLRGAVLCGVVR